MRLLIFLIYCTNFVTGFWWWFGGGESTGQNEPQGGEQSASGATVMSQVFAPFEMSNKEEKFLNEAKNYLQNLPMLDQCNMLIINRLKSSCNQMSDEQLSKLSVNLLNCQSAVEGRKTFKCNDEMALSECTGPMDSDTWNSYHIISNRARAICYNMRQMQFRMKTEHTVNQLASSTLDNINLLKQLAVGQKKMQEVTEEAVTTLTDNQDELLTNQNALKDKQAVIGGLLQHNMKDLIKEKKLIAESHHQVEHYTQMINEQLETLSKELKAQDSAKKESQKEILKDLDSVKNKADEVLEKLGTTFDGMENYHDTVEDKQNKTLKNLEEIQETIAFMSELLQKLYTAFDEQLPWLQNIFGGTVDKLTIVTILLGHLGFFIASFFGVLFVNGPSVTRVLMLVMIPLNCIATIHESECKLDYLQMAWVLAGSVPTYYFLQLISQAIHRFRHGKSSSMDQLQVKSNDDKFNFRTPEAIKAKTDFTEMIHNSLSYTPIADHKSTPQSKHDTSFMFMSEHDVITNSSPIRNLQFNSYPDSNVTGSPSVGRKYIDTVLNSSSPCLNTSVGGSVKCSATTKMGSRCRKSAVGCTSTCRIHTPQKNL